MPKWQKGKKLGEIKFKNVAIGPYCPAGQAIKISVVDGLSIQTQTVALGGTFSYRPNNHRVLFTIKPVTVKVKQIVWDLGEAKSYGDHLYYVYEHPEVYTLDLTSIRNKVPLPGQKYVY